MKYWVYINDKVVGPYSEDKLAELEGFTPDTLICTETVEPGKMQEWVKASSVFDFDDTNRTITKGGLTPQDMANGASMTDSNSLTAQLLAKIDLLTQEIEGMKGKLDEAVAASNAAQEAAAQQMRAITSMQQQYPNSASTATEEISLTEQNTDSTLEDTSNLEKHAEEMVAEAKDENQKPAEFLDEIQIGENKDNAAEKITGEEVVISSALDSLYNKDLGEQTEKEKEDTFQDLLSPFKAVATAAAAGAVAAGVANAVENKKESEDKQEKTENTTDATAEEQDSSTLTPQQREELINEITTPAAQEDAVSQAIAEAEKQQNIENTPVAEEEAVPNDEEPVAEEKPAEEAPADVPVLDENLATNNEEPTTEEKPAEEAPADVPVLDENLTASNEEPVAEEKPEEAPADVPTLDENPVAEDIDEKVTLSEEHLEGAPDFDIPQLDENEVPMETMQADKDPLELTGQPQLNIQDVEEDKPSSEGAIQEISQVGVDTDNIDLTPMAEEKDENPAEDKKEDTVRELIPGKELEQPKEDEGLISQKDLDEAFAERDAQAEQNNLNFATVTSNQELPQGQDFYNPKEMTEVQLKEGSTYLISDFIPPAETGNKNTFVGNPFVDPVNEPESKETEDEDVVEEIVPQNRPSTQQEQEKVTEDITMSKISLENTIKTKRGATMDIRTVPMVKEPASSDRLDLSDADLDLSAQHDLKSADVNQSGNKLTKIVLIGLSVVFLLIVLYFMTSYLGLVPNIFGSKEATVEETQEDEMFDTSSLQEDSINSFPQVNASTSTNPLDNVVNEVKNYLLVNGSTLQQLINSRHPTAQNLIEWSATNAVEPDNYSILVKVPPDNPQGFKISYRFNYNMVTKALEPTISDAKNLLDSVR